MPSSPITSWQVDGEKMETVTNFLFLGSKITADGDFSHERTLAPWKKSYDQLRQHIKKQRHYLASKGPSSQSYGFPVVTYRYESWTIKKPESQRIVFFELCCWRRLLRVPWTARRFNQCIIKEISPEYSLEGLMLKLKLQYFGHLMWRTDSVEKTLMLGKIEDGKRRGWQRMVGWHHWLDGHEFELAPGVGDGQGGLACCSPWVCKESDKTERLNWTEQFALIFVFVLNLTILPWVEHK